jgi:hypothetical protein
MDELNLALFLTAAFFGGLTSGLSGFAMGLVVSAFGCTSFRRVRTRS